MNNNGNSLLAGLFPIPQNSTPNNLMSQMLLKNSSPNNPTDMQTQFNFLLNLYNQSKQSQNPFSQLFSINPKQQQSIPTPLPPLNSLNSMNNNNDLQPK